MLIVIQLLRANKSRILIESSDLEETWVYSISANFLLICSFNAVPIWCTSLVACTRSSTGIWEASSVTTAYACRNASSRADEVGSRGSPVVDWEADIKEPCRGTGWEHPLCRDQALTEGLRRPSDSSMGDDTIRGEKIDVTEGAHWLMVPFAAWKAGSAGRSFRPVHQYLEPWTRLQTSYHPSYLWSVVKSNQPPSYHSRHMSIVKCLH